MIYNVNNKKKGKGKKETLFTYIRVITKLPNSEQSYKGKVKTYTILCTHSYLNFSVKHTALRRKSKDWLARNQNDVSEWSDMSAHGLFFQSANTINIQLSVLV